MAKAKLKKKSAGYSFGAGGGIQGAASMAAAGAGLGPWGIAGGALIGGITGWLQEDAIQDSQESILKDRTAYQKKVDSMNSIYSLPGGYNQVNPAASPAQFQGGGSIKKIIKSGVSEGKEEVAESTLHNYLRTPEMKALIKKSIQEGVEETSEDVNQNTLVKRGDYLQRFLKKVSLRKKSNLTPVNSSAPGPRENDSKYYQFNTGGGVKKMALANDDTYNKGGGVKLIRASGEKGAVKKVDAGDFVIPNPSVDKFKSDTGLNPDGVVTAKSKGDTKIIAGEKNKAELLVKKKTALNLKKKGVRLENYAPDAEQGPNKQHGGPAGPTESQNDYYQFGVDPAFDVNDLLKKSNPLVAEPLGTSLMDMRGTPVPSKKRDFLNASLTLPDSESLSRKADIGNMALNKDYVDPSTYQGMPLESGNSPFVDRMLGKDPGMSLANLKDFNKTSAAPQAATLTAGKGAPTDMTRLNDWHTYMQVANAGILLSNLLQKPPQLAGPTLFNPVLEDRSAQIQQERRSAERGVEKVLAGARSNRQASGITYDTDLVAKGINAQVKLGEATDKALSDQQSRNLEVTNKANLYNLEKKDKHSLTMFDVQNQYQHEKAKGVSDALSNVGTLLHTRNEAIHHLNAENLNTSQSKWQKLTSFGVNSTLLPGQPGDFESFNKLSSAEQDAWIEKAQKASLNPDGNKTLSNGSLIYTSYLPKDYSLNGLNAFMTEPSKL